MSRFVLRWFCAALLLAMTVPGRADTAAFDLVGPKVEVRVDRGGKSLPIAEVPNLLAGDRLWIHPSLPESQSVHYLMIVAFLRGSTNPPPDYWFTKVETWTKPVREEGITVTVPDEAQQALIFLAPETGGDFSTLRAAVRGKPGAFVRAAQDLVQASLDRARLEKYLHLVRETSQTDVADLQQRTTLVARSLSIKVDQNCFDKPTAQQEQCLTQNSDQLVLDDAHSQNMVSTLASGTSADLLTQISNTPHLGGASYSPYVGAVVDLARILGSAHTAKYQYIPALALPEGESLNLKLNNPPSFRNPKSVIVVGLPPIGHSPVPPLRAVEAKQVFCAQHPKLVLPAEGAPLVFGTELGHDFTLKIASGSGSEITLPATADADLGGFLVDTKSLKGGRLSQNATAILRGMWGFEEFEGPTYHLRASEPTNWVVGSSDASALIVGRQDTLHLQSDQAVCVENITVKGDNGGKVDSEWKAVKPDTLEVKVSLQKAVPGALTMEMKKYGAAEPDVIPLHSYSEAGRLNSFSIHAGDSAGVLSGTRLDQVAKLELSGVTFSPGNLSRANQQDELAMATTQPEASAKLQPASDTQAKVTLKDGRILDVKAAVEAPRPKVVLLSKSGDAPAPDAKLRLGGAGDVAQDSELRFALKSVVPEKFAASEKIEVATADESFRVQLSMADGNLTFQDSQTVLAVLDPLKHLGPSAFGPLKFRPVDASGTAGEWQPLATLVRVPALGEVHCVNAPERQCTLSGQKLFLLESVSADPQFSNAVQVPEGFVDTVLSIPPVAAGKPLYFKLRDDPATVSSAVLPVLAGAKSLIGQK